MKNLLLIMLSLLASVSLYAMTDGDSETGSKEIEIKTGKNAGNSSATINPREFITVEALLYCNSGDIIFTFHANIGEVTITVNDANGNVVATSTCDSSVSDSATIVVPTLTGSYTINVVSPLFIGQGSYEL